MIMKRNESEINRESTTCTSTKCIEKTKKPIQPHIHTQHTHIQYIYMYMYVHTHVHQIYTYTLWTCTPHVHIHIKHLYNIQTNKHSQDHRKLYHPPNGVYTHVYTHPQTAYYIILPLPCYNIPQKRTKSIKYNILHCTCAPVVWMWLMTF